MAIILLLLLAAGCEQEGALSGPLTQPGKDASQPIITPQDRVQPQPDRTPLPIIEPAQEPAGEAAEPQEDKIPVGGTITPASDHVTEPQVAAEEFERICAEAGGLWNPCGSSCRGAPPGTKCIQMCVPVCECGGIAGLRCPQGYTCADYLPPGATDQMGICKLAS